MIIHEVFKIIRFLVDNLIFVYAAILFSIYIILALISGYSLNHYLKKNSFYNYENIISSPFAPAISIIAPAYNESVSIVGNIRALLSEYYHAFEVIIVNDGSNDDTFEKIKNAYELEKVNHALNPKLKTQKIRGIYKSKNESFENLIVIDKENGGKGDALNAGINIAQHDYFLAIDVDCILEPDALQKLVKPFLEEDDRKIIATGGVIRIVNSCKIDRGNLSKVRLPKKLLPKFQVLEYTRAFLMGRMAWSKFNGLLLISGALGLFDKKIVIECGGYSTATVGEDMELVVRMRRHMAKKKQKYRVVYIPDPLVWTETPDNLKTLGRQRNRWTRGTIDTIFMHKQLFFNPRYGNMGLLSYPFWCFFEWLAPIIEALGLLYFLIIALLGYPNWNFFFLLLASVYAFAITFSTYAILFEEISFQRYKEKSDIVKLFLSALLEPFFYHPLIVWWALKGNWDFFVLKKSSWGQISRRGFSNV